MTLTAPKLSPVAGTGHGLFERKLFIIAEDWTVTVEGITFTIPKGRKTDFASVPRCIQWLLSDGAVYSLAAVIHDWLYFSGVVTQDVADATFHAILKEEGVRKFDRVVCWGALILFGHGAYERHRKLGHPTRNADVF